MSNKRMILLTTTAVCLAIGLATTKSMAEQPEPVIRTFGFYATGGVEGPDFQDDDSVGITVLPDQFSPVAGLTIEFSGTENNPEWLRNSTWVAYPAHHAVKGGESVAGVYLWLVDEETPNAPAIGAHTFTGPDGLIDGQISYRIRPCQGGSDCLFGEGSNRWVVDEGIGAGAAFVVVRALFSR